MIPSHFQKNRYDLFRPQTSRNDLVRIVTIEELLLHLFLATKPTTPHPSSSQQAQTDQLSPREHPSPIQQFIRKSATRMARNSIKSRPREPKNNRSQPNYPDSQSALRSVTRHGYKF